MDLFPARLSTIYIASFYYIATEKHYMHEDWTYRRGEIYLADLEPHCGSEQGGCRPVLVIQNNAGNFFSPTLIVAPLSGKRKKISFPTHYPLENEDFLRLPSVVLLEQIRTIDKQRIHKYLGRLSGKQMAEIDEVICISLEMTIPEVEDFP